MENKLEFKEIYEAYNLCLKNKKKKRGTYKFVNEELCKNLIELMDKLNNRIYIPQQSNCYVVTEPALREIYAAQFGDRIVQHFYMKEIENILEEELILEKYNGKHKELLLYLTPVIFENNPALNCRYKCNEKIRKRVPQRRKMNPDSNYGMAIGNLTAQAASNLNLKEFDKYVTEKLELKEYVRYVDDIVIISNNKTKLIENLPKIIKKLEETHQKVNNKKTKIDTAYHGVQFLGKVSYPYGYQKPGKQLIIRVCQKGKNIEYSGKMELLAKTNSQIGTLKRYNARKLILQYKTILPKKTQKDLKFNENMCKFLIK